MAATLEGRNQWRDKGRLRFPINGLVYYAPLWNSQLAGSPFNAWNIADGGVHSSTVTGTTQGIQGRTCDGDDYINSGSAASLRPTTVSMLLWVKPTSDVANAIPFSMPYDNGGVWDAPWVAYEMARNDAGGGVFNMVADINVGGTYRNLDSLIASPINVWKLYGMTFDGTTLRTYVNGVAGATGSWTGNITYGTTPSLALGVRSVDSLGAYLTGILGEAWVWNRALSAAEMLRVHLATKWRY